MSADMISLLLNDADSYTWVAATNGAENAASYQLATEKSVMPIGGFNGGDSSPTLEQFQSYVAEDQIRYYIASGDGGRGGSSQDGAASTIATWVSEHYASKTVDGVTVYDLT